MKQIQSHDELVLSESYLNELSILLPNFESIDQDILMNICLFGMNEVIIREFTSWRTIYTTAPQRRTNDTSSFSRTSQF